MSLIEGWRDRMRIKHRTFLRSKELRKLQDEFRTRPGWIHQALREQMGGKIAVERIVLEDKTELYVVGNQLWLIRRDDFFIPALQALLEKTVTLPKVVIDMGAVPYIAKGADVMAPGIVEIPAGLQTGAFVVIIDQNNRTPLAVGRLRMDSAEISIMEKGRAIETLHYVGDKLWNLMKQLFE